MEENNQAVESLPVEEIHYTTFGERLREIREDNGWSQTELAKKLGTTKQMISCYELNQRSPRIELVRKYAKALGKPVDYLLGDTEAEAISWTFWTRKQKKKPFYKIFMDVTDELGLDIPGTVRVTGLTDRQVRTIITREMKVAPLDLALQLSETLNVPLAVWLDEEAYTPPEVSAEAYEVARAYDKADFRDQNMARLALKMELLKEEK
jgi:transcriptional regulator with XRE-family HTH domain